MACCTFQHINGQWNYAIEHTHCMPYDTVWMARLRDAHHLSGKDLWHLHADFGRLSGGAVRDFIRHKAIQNVTLIGSHGHTVFHFPADKFTTQIGDGAALAYEAGVPVVCDFRSADLAKGGQGAPLVPIGDRLLLGQYDFLLNLGGIANVTINRPGQTVAFDICSANQVLNVYAGQKGLEYDDGGQLAASGTLHQGLFDALNGLDYYAAKAPKSLDNGYTRTTVVPLIDTFDCSIEDKLHTMCEHVAYQIAQHVEQFPHAASDKMLVTGGGTFNTYLMQRVAHHVPVTLAPVDPLLSSFKEALVFAFAGVLRWRGEANVLSSVTGASADSVGGAIYLP